MSQESSTHDAEQLVAYLDGELDDASAMQVEQLLASTPETRHVVERLSRTWDLLDLLPNSRVSQEFTHRTLSAIRSQASTTSIDDEEAESTRIKVAAVPRSSAEFWRKIGLRVAALVGLAIAAVAGFRSTYDPGNKDSEALLRNYPVIQRLDEYRSIRDPKFLKELHDSAQFSRESRNHVRPNP